MFQRFNLDLNPQGWIPLQVEGEENEVKFVINEDPEIIRSRGGLRCFTLIEILVVMAIATMMIVFVTQIMNATANAIKISGSILDLNSQARFVFARFDEDLRQMPKRLDLSYHMTNDSPGNDFLRFISCVNGPGGDRKLSLLGYRLMQESDGFIGLYRASRGFQWEEAGFMGLDETLRPPNLFQLSPSISLSASDYDLVSPSVFKVLLSFQKKSDGSISQYPPLFTLGTNKISASEVQITNLASLVVTLVMIDSKSKKKLSSSQMQQLVQRFEEPPIGVLPAAHWNTNLLYHFPKLMEGMPGQAAKSIRVYERFYLID